MILFFYNVLIHAQFLVRRAGRDKVVFYRKSSLMPEQGFNYERSNLEHNLSVHGVKHSLYDSVIQAMLNTTSKRNLS